MYLIPQDIYEKILESFDEKDREIVNRLNAPEVGNDDGAFPQVPPNPLLPPQLPPHPLLGLLNQLQNLHPDMGNDNGGPGVDQGDMDVDMGGNDNDDDDPGEGPSTSRKAQHPNKSLTGVGPSVILNRPLDPTRGDVPNPATVRPRIVPRADENPQDASTPVVLNPPAIPGVTANTQIDLTPEVSRTTSTPSAQVQSIDRQSVINSLMFHSDRIKKMVANLENTKKTVKTCALCQQSFPSSAALMSHLKNVHGKKKSPSELPTFPNINPSVQGINTDDIEQQMEIDLPAPTPQNELFRFTAKGSAVRTKKPVTIKKVKSVKRPEPKARKREDSYTEWLKNKKKRGALGGDDEDEVSESLLVVSRAQANSFAHDGIAVRICELCNSEFNNKKSLIRHIKNIHNADAHYKQLDTTGVKRKTMSSKPTELSPSKKTPSYLHKCRLCDSLFVKENGLKRHIANVHNSDEDYKSRDPQGEKRKRDNLSCEFCSKIYKSVKSLNNHIDKLHKTNPKAKKNSDYESWKK